MNAHQRRKHYRSLKDRRVKDIYTSKVGVARARTNGVATYMTIEFDDGRTMGVETSRLRLV